jgi:hypothetical protein
VHSTLLPLMLPPLPPLPPPLLPLAPLPPLLLVLLGLMPPGWHTQLLTKAQTIAAQPQLPSPVDTVQLNMCAAPTARAVMRN